MQPLTAQVAGHAVLVLYSGILPHGVLSVVDIVHKELAGKFFFGSIGCGDAVIPRIIKTYSGIKLYIYIYIYTHTHIYVYLEKLKFIKIHTTLTG